MASGYDCLVAEAQPQNNGGATQQRTMKGDKKFPWGLQCDDEAKILILNIMNDALPLGKEVLKRNLASDTRCCMCRIDEEQHESPIETKEHLFRDCDLAKRIWATSVLGIRVEQQNTIPLEDWIKNWIVYLRNQVGWGATRAFIATLKDLWSHRNEVRF